MGRPDGWWPPPGNGDRPCSPPKDLHAGHWVCEDCPRAWYAPPFLPFTFLTHIRSHLRLLPDHSIVWWCSDHQAYEHPWHPHWRIDGWYWVHTGPWERGCLIMCSYRRVDVHYPDGRTMPLVVNEDRDNGHRCESCGLDAAGFSRRQLPPHDTLQHQELYFGATVTRGRRLSQREVERLVGPFQKRDVTPAGTQVPLAVYQDPDKRRA